VPTKLSESNHVVPALLVDLKTASEILGIASSSVRGLVRRRALPKVRAGRGGKIFIPRVAIVQFVATAAKKRRTRANT
jgi:hypothetical protein